MTSEIGVERIMVFPDPFVGATSIWAEVVGGVGMLARSQWKLNSKMRSAINFVPFDETFNLEKAMSSLQKQIDENSAPIDKQYYFGSNKGVEDSQPTPPFNKPVMLVFGPNIMEINGEFNELSILKARFTFVNARFRV